MSLNFPKTLMVLLVCLTFIGQAMASTIMSYHMMSMTGMSAPEPAHDMSKMTHTSHHMASDMTSDMNADESETSSEDCCVKTCNCFTSGCSTVAVLLKDISNYAVGDFSDKIHSFSTLAISQQLTSLYRPPILS